MLLPEATERMVDSLARAGGVVRVVAEVVNEEVVPLVVPFVVPLVGPFVTPLVVFEAEDGWRFISQLPIPPWILNSASTSFGLRESNHRSFPLFGEASSEAVMKIFGLSGVKTMDLMVPVWMFDASSVCEGCRDVGVDELVFDCDVGDGEVVPLILAASVVDVLNRHRRSFLSAPPVNNAAVPSPPTPPPVLPLNTSSCAPGGTKQTLRTMCSCCNSATTSPVAAFQTLAV